MKLETVSKVKGWIALVGWSVCVLIVVVISPRVPTGAIGLVAGFSGWVGIIYTVKWFRLRRRMRMVEYTARVVAKGSY